MDIIQFRHKINRLFCKIGKVAGGDRFFQTTAKKIVVTNFQNYYFLSKYYCLRPHNLKITHTTVSLNYLTYFEVNWILIYRNLECGTNIVKTK